MESLTKNKLELSQIKKLAERAFGHGETVVSCRELTQGYFNAIYLVEFEDGFEVVLKIAPPKDVTVLRYEQNIIEAEHQALALVKEYAGPKIPAPRIYFYDKSCEVCDSAYFFLE